MKYKALRPCKFAGVMYLIGDLIPDGIVQNQASMRLVRNGVIEAVADGGVTPPPVTTSEPETEVQEEPIEPIEPVIQETSEAEKPEADSAIQESPEEEEPEVDGETDEITVDKLMRLKKSELLELAEANGLDVAKLKAKSKSEIAQAVFEVIGK